MFDMRVNFIECFPIIERDEREDPNSIRISYTF